MKNAAREAGLVETGDLSHLPPLFATDLLGRGHDIRTVQELIGRRDVTTAMIYTDVLQYGARALRSPLDAM